MEIKEIREGGRLVLMPQGRVDTVTAPDLEAAVHTEGVEELVFDLAAVDYISSAGLRVLLASQKKMVGRKMVITHVQPAVREVLDITGFSDIFTIV